MFMEFTARQMDFVFRQKHMSYLRKRMALEIKNEKLMWFDQQPEAVNRRSKSQHAAAGEST